mmetsp:Transcript_13958/g.29832  ORF Transcript_13958/g.29832 Transcript_13958/m.29832 type:complete len:297 (+) Transcript_13958:260-1150(+)
MSALLCSASTEASHVSGPSEGGRSSSTRQSENPCLLSPPPTRYQQPARTALACPARPRGIAPSAAGTLHSRVSVSSMSKPACGVRMDPPPKTTMKRSATAAAECFARGSTLRPFTGGVLHSILPRSSTATSPSSRRSELSPPKTHSLFLMRVAVWPPRANGAAPEGCSLTQACVPRSMEYTSSLGTVGLSLCPLMWPPTARMAPLYATSCKPVTGGRAVGGASALLEEEVGTEATELSAPTRDQRSVLMSSICTSERYFPRELPPTMYIMPSTSTAAWSYLGMGRSPCTLGATHLL